MRWWGTAVGGAIGLVIGGPVGALFGAALGQGVDRGFLGKRFRPGLTPEQKARIQDQFFQATFKVLGHMAKADGRVSEAEIAFAESVMDRMALSPILRRSAIHYFNEGKAPSFEPVPVLERLQELCADQGPLLHLFLEVQLSAAYLESEPVPAQRQILDEVRRALRISSVAFRGLEQLVAIQRRVQSAAGAASRERGPRRPSAAPPKPSPSPLASAYATLGVAPKASDAEIKRAYRRLMSQHHPDKLSSLGLPEEAMRMASQKTQEIRRAYEAITRSRAP